MSLFNFSFQPDDTPFQNASTRPMRQIELNSDTINNAEPAEQLMFLSAILAQSLDLAGQIHHLTSNVIDVDVLGEDLCTDEGLFPVMSVFYLSAMEELVHELVDSVVTATDTPLVSAMLTDSGGEGESLGVEVFDKIVDVSATSNKIHDAWHEYIDPVQFPEGNFTRDEIVGRARTVLSNLVVLCERFNDQVVSLLKDENVQKFAHRSVRDMLKNMMGGN